MDLQSFDRDYVRRLTEGDAEVEKHFTGYFSELLWIKLHKRLRSPQLAEEARQETFLRVLTQLRQRGGLEHPERLGAFVNGVCNNVLLELFRSETRHPPAPRSPENQGDSHPAPEEAIPDEARSPEASLISEDRKRLVENILSELPDKDCRLLRMVFWEEKDRLEICRDLKVNSDHLRVLLHRAKSRFREGLHKTSGL